MNILSWYSFGESRVFAAETPLHFFKIHEELRKNMKGWGEDERLDALFEAMGVAKDREDCKGLFQDFIRGHLGTHEKFEDFSFTKVINS